MGAVASVLFDANCINRLNKEFAKIKKYMFFAADYKPKPKVANNPGLNLRIAITNGCALYSDCSNYVVPWLEQLAKEKFITDTDKKKFTKTIRQLKDFRALFCHNQGEQAVRQKLQAKKFLEIMGIKYEDNLPFFFQGKSEEHEQIIEKLNTRNMSFVNTIMQVCEKISFDEGTRKALFEKIWCEEIARWYYRSTNLRYIAEENYFNLYWQAYSVGQNRKAMWDYWIKKINQDWNNNESEISEDICGVIRTSDRPAYPVESLHKVIVKRYIKLLE